MARYIRGFDYGRREESRESQLEGWSGSWSHVFRMDVGRWRAEHVRDAVALKFKIRYRHSTVRCSTLCSVLPHVWIESSMINNNSCIETRFGFRNGLVSLQLVLKYLFTLPYLTHLPSSSIFKTLDFPGLPSSLYLCIDFWPAGGFLFCMSLITITFSLKQNQVKAP